MAYASRFLRIMSPFMEGIDVENVQVRLTELGYYEGEVDGIYDKESAETVRDYQEAQGLMADGVVGPDTWNAIGLSEEYIDYFDSTYTIIIDQEKFLLTLKEGNTTTATFPVAVGKPETPTPNGNWRIIQKTLNPGGPFGVRWMRLSVPWGGYGIHGTDAPESIGTAASHGCVRMQNEDVTQLYDIVPLGTEVKIIGETFTGRLLYVGVDGGSDIQRVQEILETVGYYNGPVDGNYSEEVRDAVMEFQEDYGLFSDGVVDTNTFEALEKVYDTLVDSREP